MSDTYFYTSILQVEMNGVWLNVSGPSTKATIDIPGKYYIRVYKNVEDAAHQLNASGGSGGVDSVRVHATRTTDIGDWVNSTPVQTVNYVSGNLALTRFEAEFKANTVPGTFKADILVERYDGTNWIPVPLKSGYTIQAVNYTSTTGLVPPFPINKPDGSGQTTDLYNALGGKTNSGLVRWDAATNEWILATETKITGSANAYEVGYTSYNIDGSKKLSTPLGSQNGKTGAAWTAANNRLLKAVNDTAAGGTTTGGAYTPAVVTSSNAAYSMNPPTHIWTRRPPLDAILKYGNTPLEQSILSERGNKPGWLFQDASTATNLNKKLKNSKATTVYGFNFTYNPTTISYTTTANTPIDWTLGTSDPANILGGPTVVTFDLYLNRIRDVAELKSGQYKDSNYAKPLTATEKDGLLYRGTEYDIEFLYRVVNGSPAQTNLLTYSGETSDFGYITGTPFWLNLHDNMKYYGGLAGLSVNHVMFSKDMVPILTVVSLTINRYPIFDYSTKVSDLAKGYYKSTNTTPGTK